MNTKRQREFWMHNINPITGYVIDTQSENYYLLHKGCPADEINNEFE